MRHVPRSFVLALAGGAAAACALTFARAATRRDPRDLDSFAAAVIDAASYGLAIAVAALLLAGGIALRRREPARPVGLLLAGASLLLAAAVARPVCEWLVLDRLADYQAVLEARRWLGRLDTTGAFTFSLGLVVLGEHAERVRSLTVPLFALAILAHPPLAVADELARWLGDVPGTSSVWKAAAGLAAIQVAFAAAALAALAGEAETDRGPRAMC
jgi:hypothetical protein